MLADTRRTAVIQVRGRKIGLLSSDGNPGTTPVRNKDRTPDAPLDRQIRASGGIEYGLSETLDLGLAYTYLNGGSADIRQSGALRGELVGDYKRNDIHFIAAYVNWRW